MASLANLRERMPEIVDPEPNVAGHLDAFHRAGAVPSLGESPRRGLAGRLMLPLQFRDYASGSTARF
jgi:hypothetical protein